MKIIFVYGSCDYAALKWERLTDEKEAEIIQEMLKTKKRVEYQEEAYAEIKEFQDVDPEFIAFVNKEIIDYDYAKHTNYYIYNENTGKVEY